MFLVPQIFVVIPTYNEYHPDSAGLSALYHDGLDASVIVSSNKNARTTVLLRITSC